MNHDFVSGAEIKPVELLQESFALMKPNLVIMALIFLVGGILSSIAGFILTGPIMCGFFICVAKQFDTGNAEFGDLFKGFEYFLESFLATLIMTMGVCVLAIPLIILMVGMGYILGEGSTLHTLFILGLGLFSSAIAIVASALVIFTYFLIVDRGLKAMNALKTSIAAVRANFMSMLILMIVCAVVLTISMMLCFLPYLVAFPVTQGAMVLAYRRIFPKTAMA